MLKDLKAFYNIHDYSVASFLKSRKVEMLFLCILVLLVT